MAFQVFYSIAIGEERGDFKFPLSSGKNLFPIKIHFTFSSRMKFGAYTEMQSCFLLFSVLLNVSWQLEVKMLVLPFPDLLPRGVEKRWVCKLPKAKITLIFIHRYHYRKITGFALRASFSLVYLSTTGVWRHSYQPLLGVTRLGSCVSIFQFGWQSDVWLAESL